MTMRQNSYLDLIGNENDSLFSLLLHLEFVTFFNVCVCVFVLIIMHVIRLVPKPGLAERELPHRYQLQLG